MEQVLDDADGGGDANGGGGGPLRLLDGGGDGGEVHDDAVDGRLVIADACVTVLGHLLRVEADVATAVDGEVVEEEARGAALVEERGGLLEEWIDGDGVVESLEGVSLGGLQRLDRPVRALLGAPSSPSRPWPSPLAPADSASSSSSFWVTLFMPPSILNVSLWNESTREA